VHARTVARWADRHDVLAACNSLDDVLSLAKINSDCVLAALLAEVARGDQLAARVVLQTLLGRMVRMAQRDPRSSIDDYLAHLWCVIISYPLDRRPARIAANLSMDTLKAVSREYRWFVRGEVTLCPSSESLDELLPLADVEGGHDDSPPQVEVEVCQVLQAGSALSFIDDSATALLHSVYVDGLPSRAVAVRFHTSVGMVRVRCRKAIRQLAAHAIELADVA
jgi:hypothetical protein